MQTKDAETIRHLIGNSVFAIETNLMYLRRRASDEDSRRIFESMQNSLEQIKDVLAKLDKDEG